MHQISQFTWSITKVDEYNSFKIMTKNPENSFILCIKFQRRTMTHIFIYYAQKKQTYEITSQ